jgi:serine/threonine protein kinase
MAYKRIRPVFDDDGRVDDAAALEQFIDELKALSAPEVRSHPNINRLRGIAFETQSHRSDGTLFPVLMSDPSPLGNLLDFVQDIIQMVDEPYWECCLDIARGLQVLHANNFIHGDVKCENVLVFPSAEFEGRKFIAKLTDFGCSMDLSTIEPNAFTKLRGATPPYDAPESDTLIQRGLLPFTDVYSYGLLV